MEKLDRLTKIEVAYLAGWFDRRGCISILKYERKSKKEQNQVQHTLTLTLTAPEGRKAVLEHWRERTGLGSISYNRQGSFWLWRISARQAERFLRVVFPLLMFQPDRAGMALRFRNTKQAGSRRVTEEILRDREFCRNWLSANVG